MTMQSLDQRSPGKVYCSLHSHSDATWKIPYCIPDLLGAVPKTLHQPCTV